MTIQQSVDIAKLPEQEIKILQAIKREGEKHLKYFYDTMKHFTFPEKRVKCFDTKYYEDALPQIERILRERNEIIETNKI